MSEEKQMNVTLDLNALLSAYNKEEFMRKVFKEALVANNEILVNGLKDHLIKEVLRGEVFEEIKGAVTEKIQEEIKSNKLVSGYEFQRQVSDVVRQAVDQNKPKILNHVSSAITQKDMREKTASHISNIVEGRVMRALGEVCDGCGDDY